MSRQGIITDDLENRQDTPTEESKYCSVNELLLRNKKIFLPGIFQNKKNS